MTDGVDLPVIVVDLDGTLVDSTYHHAMTWYRAFQEVGAPAPAWQVHRAIGMGGDQLVAHAAGDDIEREHGDRLRARHRELFSALRPTVSPLPGASEFVAALSERGHAVVVASSAEEAEVDHYIGLLDIARYLSGAVSAADVTATKPQPDLCVAAREAAAQGDDIGTLVIGDSVWDAESAGRAGFRAAAVLTGGISETELRGHGARFVGTSLADVRRWIESEYPVDTVASDAYARALTRLQGEVAARPGLPDDADAFAATVEHLVTEVVERAGERPEVGRRLVAMRTTLQQAGS